MTETAITTSVLFVAALLLYFLPSLIASGRHHHNHVAIFVLNLLLGWTFLGWVIALVWAFTEPRARFSHAQRESP